MAMPALRNLHVHFVDADAGFCDGLATATQLKSLTAHQWTYSLGFGPTATALLQLRGLRHLTLWEALGWHDEPDLSARLLTHFVPWLKQIETLTVDRQGLPERAKALLLLTCARLPRACKVTTKYVRMSAECMQHLPVSMSTASCEWLLSRIAQRFL
jgi:hypothetical protein